MVNEKTIYDDIVRWEKEVGELFTDYFDIHMNVPNFMFWARGKGYLSVAKFNNWQEHLKDGNISVLEFTNVLYSWNDNINYSIFDSGEHQERAYRIVAEFISESMVYQERLDLFINPRYKGDK